MNVNIVVLLLITYLKPLETNYTKDRTRALLIDQIWQQVDQWSHSLLLHHHQQPLHIHQRDRIHHFLFIGAWPGHECSGPNIPRLQLLREVNLGESILGDYMKFLSFLGVGLRCCCSYNGLESGDGKEYYRWKYLPREAVRLS